MTTGKLCLAALLGAMPSLAIAQPTVNVDVGVGVNIGADVYATVAPGDPVEAVDVFYDQLSPYGVWVDEPDVGRVFIPDTADYVPYTVGHWQYTDLGFVWISTEPYAWATSHYGRWAYSRAYGRWYWLPDTSWGPAWVEWRMAGDDFGWAPLAPDVVVRAGWQPPPEAWHYCGAEHVLDVNLVRYYVPRERVVEIHRSARPIEHTTTISNVKVIVGPRASVLRAHRIAVRPVKVAPRTIGRWTPAESRAQVERARTRRATFETQNQRRLETKPKLQAAHVRVVEEHPQIKAQVTARMHGRAEPSRPESGRVEQNRTDQNRPEPARVEPSRPEPNRGEQNRAQPNRPEPNRGEQNRAQPNRPEPNREQNRTEPNRPEPNRPDQNRAQPNRPEPNRGEQNRTQPNRPEPNREQNRTEPNRPEPNRPDQNRAQPNRPEPNREQNRAEQNRAEQNRAEQNRAEQNRAEQNRRPEPNRAEPKRPEPSRPEQKRAEPSRAERPDQNRVEPKRPEPEQNRAVPSRAERPEPSRAERPEPNRIDSNRAERRPEPNRAEPSRTERPEPNRADRKDPDRKDPDRH